MKFGLVLSGCGQNDGSETHEVILTLLALDAEGVEWEAFAPNEDQFQVVNHVKNQLVQGEKRNALEESSRLVRGKIADLATMKASNYDAVIFPGGFGAVSTLCNWGEHGENFTLHSEIARLMDEIKQNQIPTGFICIAPILATKLHEGAQVTIGDDKDIAKQIENLGLKHINASAYETVVDKKHKIVSTPANMVAKSISEVSLGIHKLVKELKDLCGQAD